MDNSQHFRSIRTLVVVLFMVVVNHSLASNLKSFVGLNTGHKRIYIVTYHAVTVLGDLAVWPGVVTSDVVNKQIKRGIIISIDSIKLIGFDWLQFKFDSLQIKIGVSNVVFMI